jgi:hypothetical protein
MITASRAKHQFIAKMTTIVAITVSKLLTIATNVAVSRSLYGSNIVMDSHDDLSDTRGRVEGERHLLKMTKKLIPQIEDDAFPNPCIDVVLQHTE